MTKYYRVKGLKSVMKISDAETIIVSSENNIYEIFPKRIDFIKGWHLEKCSSSIWEISKEEFEEVVRKVEAEKQLL